MIETYEAAVSYIHNRGQFKKIPTLQLMQKLLALLDSPQDKINAIHVAGTNGKGSTVAYLRNLFQAEGKTVGTFTSPFLITFNERISVNGNPISDATILELVNQVKPKADHLDATLAEGGPTEFEIITAMMFVYFAQNPVDVVLIEVGLGGLWDSTNVVKPQVSVITTIGYDHMRILGNTLSEIAQQKAGIIKQTVPVVIGNVSDAAALKVILNTANKNHADSLIFNRDFKVENIKQFNWEEHFNYCSEQLNINDLSTTLLGDYQAQNAATAITAYLVYKQLAHELINTSIIKQGILQTTWPGRFERIHNNPTVVIDGAHNVPAVTELVTTLKKQFNHQKFRIVFAALADKQYQKMIELLLTVPDVEIYLTTFGTPHNRQNADMSKLIDLTHPQVRFIQNWSAALKTAMNHSKNGDLVLVTGSLYFISDVRRAVVK